MAKGDLPAIYISSLCGYNYTPGLYCQCAEKLTSYGFECMRSRRGDDGRYWEHWYLPGVWAAEGALADAIKFEKDDKKKFKAALEFLRRISFGSFDVSVQRLCIVID